MSEFQDSPSPSNNEDNKDLGFEGTGAEEIKDENINFDEFRTFEDELGQFNDSPTESKQEHFETHDTSMNLLDLNEKANNGK